MSEVPTGNDQSEGPAAVPVKHKEATRCKATHADDGQCVLVAGHAIPTHFGEGQLAPEYRTVSAD